ncbi:hypothetical protein WOLCODRAFT_135505 [Wolfiporia cocos MD-104 SS10]|uniref:RRM domain-containing protein n=1 Tax=Wolfiporia cocos (strain MD-104) TaxID=742152 RepID=A0A2H3JDR9_WOLCO|nr:hypothetical protein WOLCODRAFT_135505 [Wolfiporia cocos MD-104 SS10]
MNRHHPYGGSFENVQSRRGGPPNGFGPDRAHRFPDRGGPPRGRGGFSRGRGGGSGPYGGFEGNVTSYDQGPPQGEMGGYNGYDAAPTQDPFYQNGNYTANLPGQFNSAPDAARYNQGYGDFEDNSNYGQGNYGNRPQKRFQRRERDDKVHDSIIEERIQRERPCRTLFIRNIKYETNSDDVRRLFEEHGEIRTFFDLIANRGMVFVTYYDLRAAERARERLQGSEISGRPIDVHYSLPRDDHGSKGADKNQQLQGTLIVTLRNSASGQPIIDEEVRRKFQQFGDVKSVRPVGERNDQMFVEFYDTRACEEAHDRLRHQGLQDGVMDIVFASDQDDPRGASPRRNDHGYDRGRDWDDHRGRRGGRGGRGRGRGYGGDDWDRRGDWGRDRDRGRSYDDDYGKGGGRGGGFDNRFDGRHAGGYGGPGPSGPPSYGGGPGAPPPAPYPAPPAAAPPVDERLEQAKKVQQLLAALKQPQGGAAQPPNAQPAPGSVPPPTMPPQIPPTGPAAGFYQSPPMPPMHSQHPPFPPPNGMPSAPGANPYPPMQSSSTPQPGQPPASALANLPPNLLALLQQNSQSQQQQSPPPGPPPPSMPQMPPYNMPQQMMPPQPPVPGVSAMSNGGQYQQLMAYLQTQKPRQ